MRVLVLSNMYPGKNAPTFGIFVHNQVMALREAGLKVDVLAVHNPAMGRFQVIRKYLGWGGRIGVHLLLLGWRYDVVHAHYVFPTGLFGLLYKRLWKSCLIVTAHGGDIDRMAKKSAFFQMWTGRVLKEADGVMAVGERLAREIKEDYGVPEDRLEVLSMGVDRSIFRPLDQAQARQELGLFDDASKIGSVRMILYVGNLIREKGLLELLEAYGRLSAYSHELEGFCKSVDEKPKAIQSLQLHLIGTPKQEAFMEQLQGKVREEGLGEVYFHGARPQHEVALWMAAADVLVLPSYMEGFGLVALEAMSCHTPVVGSDVGGLSSLLAGGCGVLVAPQEVDALTEALVRVLGDEQLRRELIEKGEARAREHDRQQVIERLIKVYRQRAKG